MAALERPFDYKLRLNGNADGEDVAVDLPETTRDGREAVVIWRNTEGWTPEDRERDRDFVARHDLTASADDIWMNGDTMVEGARSLDGLFKKRMFAARDGLTVKLQ